MPSIHGEEGTKQPIEIPISVIRAVGEVADRMSQGDYAPPSWMTDFKG